jgi:hypothetical protein
VNVSDGGVEEMEVPGDPSASAENTINCRCTIGYLPKEDSDYSWGREIEKP